MPRLSQTITRTESRIQFVASPTLDLMNAMYFTSLVTQTDGIEGWPTRLRAEMTPDLLAELDSLYNYPAGDPGLPGILGENLFAHPELWHDLASLLRYVREMPLGVTGSEADPGVQGLVYQATFRYLDEAERQPYQGMPPREAIDSRLRSLGDRDADTVMALYDRPEELRQRLASLIERFYQGHYRQEVPARLPCLERSAAVHRNQPVGDPGALARRLTGRASSCLEPQENGQPPICPGPYERLIFAPSLDMGPYTSCAAVGRVHGLFYPCEPEFVGASPEEAAEAHLARVYKALADEQRLRILRLLRERELYAQEIVERTGLHQSVVSRHLAFMRAVGLVQARKQNNMKFFSLNPDIRHELAKTLDLFQTVAEQPRK
ncbi:MAG: helix-turn-helix transcriptional regulator [Chloroflexi bacterium]|nr:helix-turn-helix transcriptional regulator [Chloroflexota bacterium]